MKTLHYIQLQLELECIRINEVGLLERIPCSNPDDVGLLHVYHNGGEYFEYFRHDVGSIVQNQVRKLPIETHFHNPSTIETILAETFPNTTASAFRTYLFPDNVKLEHVEDVTTIEKSGTLVFIILRNDNIVSSCRSVRENERGGECYVFTEPEYRGRGYARKTVFAWAHHIQSSGKNPFYSHKKDNMASAALANRLGLRPCFDVVVYGDG
jgi:RimJ/RimL family protein N-acetyltransferase